MHFSKSILRFFSNRQRQSNGAIVAVSSFTLLGIASMTTIHSRDDLHTTTTTKAGKIKQFDLVVIGGGIAGTSCAYFAKQYNPKANVLLLESDSIGAGASSHSAGTIWLAQSLQTMSEEISPTWDEVLASASLSAYRTLQHTLGIDCELEESGAVVIAETNEQSDYLAKMYLDLALRGYDIKKDSKDESKQVVELLCDTKSIHRIEPRLRTEDEQGTVVMALHLPASAHIDTAMATQAFAEACTRVGSHIREQAYVETIKLQDDGMWKITLQNTKNEEIFSSRIVLANGAAATKLFPRVKIVPVKGQIVQSEKEMPPNWLQKIIFSSWAHTDFALAKAGHRSDSIPPDCTHDEKGRMLTRHLYGRQRKDGHVIMGGGRIPYPNYDMDYQVDENVIDDVTSHVADILISSNQDKFDLKSNQMANSWACYMPFSIDGKPFVGSVHDQPGLFLALGYGPEGMSFGPGASQILAAEIWGMDARTVVPFADVVKTALDPKGRL
jgi:glycine/D-amino acid oxidase-like deaminating enzyme